MTKTSKTVVFFGNEKLATGIDPPELTLLQAVQSAGFEIEKVVTGPLNDLGEHTSQMAVLAAYGHIIPQRILDAFPLGIVNVHPSLLPLYRGPTPIEQAILDGVTKTGVSIMKLTARMDEGPLYKQKTVHLNGHETKQALTTHLQQVGAELLVDCLPMIYSGKLQPRQQPHPTRATYSQKLTKEDGVIKWTKSAAEIEREIRAFAVWPKSHTVLFNKELIITTAFIVQASGPVGETFVHDKKLAVYCGQGALVAEKIKPAGKPEMTSQAFLAGLR
jgi:methionyl-tRNA formyltransferase